MSRSNTTTTNYRNTNSYQKCRLSSKYVLSVQIIQFQPSNFTIVVDGNNPSPNSFPGSSTGTDIQLEPGPYNVTEQGLDHHIIQILVSKGFDAGSRLWK